jgi:hypothetical protein
MAGIVTCDYKGDILPDFMQKLTTCNAKNLHHKWLKDFRKFTKKYELAENDSLNIRYYVLTRLLHELLTSSDVKNGSVGPILKIPYYSLWGDYNPRNEILLTENNQSIASIPPPKESSRYLSMANLERTPVYFLSDLFDENEKYTDSKITFTSFGDSKEREMAFVALTSLMGYDSWVASNENKVWSMVRIPFRTLQGKELKLVYNVTHGENSSVWIPDTDQTYEEVRLHDVASSLNEVARGQKTLEMLSKIKVTKKAAERIQEAIDTYLKK